jgi:hypothetical protein
MTGHLMNVRLKKKTENKVSWLHTLQKCAAHDCEYNSYQSMNIQKITPTAQLLQLVIKIVHQV